jgi:hypothetical protein
MCKILLSRSWRRQVPWNVCKFYQTTRCYIPDDSILHIHPWPWQPSLDTPLSRLCFWFIFKHLLMFLSKQSCRSNIHTLESFLIFYATHKPLSFPPHPQSFSFKPNWHVSQTCWVSIYDGLHFSNTSFNRRNIPLQN